MVIYLISLKEYETNNIFFSAFWLNRLVRGWACLKTHNSLSQSPIKGVIYFMAIENVKTGFEMLIKIVINFFINTHLVIFKHLGSRLKSLKHCQVLVFLQNLWFSRLNYLWEQILHVDVSWDL